MRRVLLDTNVLMSGILFPGKPRELLRAALRGHLRLVTSEHLLEELEGVLSTQFNLTPVAAHEVRSELGAIADVVEPSEVPRICRDPDDDEVLAAAVMGKAEAIVTGDEDLLALRSHHAIVIVGVAEFAIG